MKKKEQNINFNFFLESLSNRNFLYIFLSIYYLSTIGFFIDLNSIKNNKRFLVNVYIDRASLKDYQKNTFPSFVEYKSIKFNSRYLLNLFYKSKKSGLNTNNLIKKNLSSEKIRKIDKLKSTIEFKNMFYNNKDNLYFDFSFRSKSITDAKLIYSLFYEALLSNIKQIYLSNNEKELLRLQGKNKMLNKNIMKLSSRSFSHPEEYLEEELVNYLKFLNIQRELSLNQAKKIPLVSSESRLYRSDLFNKGSKAIKREIKYLNSLKKLKKFKYLDKKIKNNSINIYSDQLSKNHILIKDIENNNKFIKDIKLNNFIKYRITKYPIKMKYLRLTFYPLILFLISTFTLVFNYENKKN